MSFKNRYPVKRDVYARKVGKLLPSILEKIFLELGASKVIITKGQGNGVDIKIWDSKGTLIIVGEVLNWSPMSLLSGKRLTNIINNLRRYSCNRVLIHTCLNKKLSPMFSSNGICQIGIGYQVLPLKYYEYFQKRSQILSRRPYSPAVKQDIKKQVKKFLKRRQISI
jgi:hypothetical protein